VRIAQPNYYTNNFKRNLSNLKFNKILERQIRRKLKNKEQLKELEDFLQLVSDTYNDFEQDHKLAQRSLEISSNELLNQNRKLKKLNTNLEKLTYAASHDLRTPLLSIMGYLQIIKLEDKLDNKLNKYFDYVTEGVERMNSLLISIQRYTEIDFWKLQPTNVDLNLILEMSIRLLSDLIEKTNTTIEYDKLPYLKTESKFIEMIFLELINNSITYAKPNVCPKIEIESKTKNNKLYISFKDNGIGIDPKYKDYIFEEFKRLHTFSEYKGNGMGLAISKKIVERLNGEISIDTGYTQGLKTDIVFKIAL